MSAPRDRAELRELLRLRAVDARLDGGLCRVCAEALGVAAVGVMLMVDRLPTTVCASGPLADRLEDLQRTLGEGPCVDAHDRGRPVAEPDLARPRGHLWPAFGPLALEAGAGAVFSFPVRVGGARLGAFSVYQRGPGRLSDDQHAEAMLAAALVAEAIIALQADAPAASLGAGLEAMAEHGAALHQATGMVSAQLGIDVVEALVRLRAHAYATGRPLAGVAADVVARRLRLDA